MCIRDRAYYAVARGETGHFEAIRVVYDPKVITYEDLLSTFWHNVDPTQANGQFCDRGDQYRTAIFVDGEDEREAAEKSKKAAEADLGRNVVTPVLPSQIFWLAEEYHQDFYNCLLYTSPSPRDGLLSRMPSSA